MVRYNNKYLRYRKQRKSTLFRAGFDKRPVKDGIYPCDDLREGDGIDPRYDSDGSRKVANRKALQLCAQIATALNLALADCGDEKLRSLLVESVVPAPDSTQLLVTLYLPADFGATEAMASLQNAYGMLRTEIAASIHRKRVPQLSFKFKV